MSMLKKMLLDILTTKDGNSFDNGRVLGTLVILAFILFSGIDVVETHQFDYKDFGIGAGLVFAGVGFNLKIKETTEPDQKQ
jgi:hypothetical protein